MVLKEGEGPTLDSPGEVGGDASSTINVISDDSESQNHYSGVCLSFWLDNRDVKYHVYSSILLQVYHMYHFTLSGLATDGTQAPLPPNVSLPCQRSYSMLKCAVVHKCHLECLYDDGEQCTPSFVEEL